MATHDLDALASEPLTIKLGGKNYKIAVTVETMMKVDKAKKESPDGDQFELIMTIMDDAGFPREKFKKLSARQAISLSEVITKHFFPEAVAEVEAAAESQ